MDAGMTGTLVGGLLGFMASVLPRLFELMENYFNHKHQQEAEAQQIDAATKGIVVARTMTNAKVLVPVEGEVSAPGIPPESGDTTLEVEEAPAIIEGPAFFTRLFNTLRFSVRPIVTYGFFALFLFVKIKGFYHGMLVDHTPVIQLLPVVWNEGTESLFAAVLAFWFGSRAFEKSRALLGKQEQVVP